MRKTIAVDLDDVLAAHVEAFIAFSNGHYSTSLTADSYTDHWADIWTDADHDEIERRALEFHTHDSVLEYAVKPGASEAIAQLAQNHDLYIVTARPKHLIKATKQWVNTHFHGVFKDLHFVPIWEKDNTVTKADICKQIGATYLIDDIPRHCNKAAQAGITTLLFGDYSWNRSEGLDPAVTRCVNWDAVLDELM